MVDRPVEYDNKRPNSLRTTDYALTEEEAEALRSDPRVVAVEIPLPDDAMAVDAIQTGDFTRGVDDSEIRAELLDWAKRRCSAAGVADDIVTSGARFGTASSSFITDHAYNIDGTGVDVVIQDDGVMTNHPEWLDENGVSRFQQINWYNAAGVSGSQSSSHYTSGSHGTHVAGTVAGRLYGWAKNAHIYSLKALGTGAISDETDRFDLIRLWHNRKPIDPRTGYRRPTIVNASWGYRWFFPGTTSEASSTFAELNYRGNDDIRFRGQKYSDMVLADRQSVGMMSSAYQRRVAAVDAAVEDLTDDGIIFVTAAGNYFGTIFRPGDIEYNNFFRYDPRSRLGDSINTPQYYNRGSSPVSDDAIVVANVNNEVLGYSGNPERLNFSSERGPRVDICAPGTAIQSSTNETGYSNRTLPYPLNSNFNTARITGTSMASPQVAGVLALYLQLNPQATPQDCKNWLAQNAQTNVMEVTAFDRYDNYTGTRGAPDRLLVNPYSSNTRTVIKQK
jgi:subtilisin family serine protease